MYPFLRDIVIIAALSFYTMKCMIDNKTFIFSIMVQIVPYWGCRSPFSGLRAFSSRAEVAQTVHCWHRCHAEIPWEHLEVKWWDKRPPCRLCCLCWCVNEYWQLLHLESKTQATLINHFDDFDDTIRAFKALRYLYYSRSNSMKHKQHWPGILMIQIRTFKAIKCLYNY